MSSYQYPPPPPGGLPATGNPAQYQNQQPPGGGPPPQQPQQGYQTPPYWPSNQTPPQYQQGAMPPPAPPAQMPAQHAPPAGPPQAYAINDEAMAEQYKKAKAELGGGGAGFLKILGPQGQVKWDSVQPGYEGSTFVHVCGPWAEGKPIFAQKKKFFWKSRSKPQGTSIIVPGSGDLVTQAIEAAGANPDPVIQEFLKNFGKPRTNYLYNVLQLDNLALHVGQDGVMRPLILDEGKQLHSRIGDVFAHAEGASNIVDYQRGRPVRLIKKKTGPRNMDIEWTAQAALNPAPVPPEFWPALQNMWDLEKFVKVATLEEQQAAIIDMGLPVPGQLGQPVQVQVPASYQPGALPPHANPYMAPEMMQQYVPPMPGQYAPPPMPAASPQPQAFGPPPPMTPPPVYSMQGQAQLPLPAVQTDTPTSAPPPGLNPPPVSSANPQMPVSGPPPVSQQPGLPPVSQQPEPAQQQQAAPSPQAQQHQVLSLPLPPGTALPEGRERCFGKFNQTDNFCIQCPGWVKEQCMRLSPQQQPAQQADGGLDALQQQLQGQQPQPQG